MTSITRLGMAVLVAGFVFVSCGDDGGTPATFTATITTTDFNIDPETPAPPLAGVQVCEVDTTNCVTTGSDGQAVLTQQPRAINGAWTLERDGYLPIIVPFNRSSDLTLTVPMAPDSIIEAFAQILGVPYPLTDEGVMVLIVNRPVDEGVVGLGGATFALVGSEGGVFYFNTGGIPDPDLTATSTGGGVGGFSEVAAQVHVVEYGGTASNCTLTTAWPGEADGTIEVPVRAGFGTQAAILCDTPTFTATITTTNFNTDPETPAPPLDGVEVCEVFTMNCVTTGSDGQAVLTLPQAINHSVTAEKDGFLSVVVPFNRTSDVTAMGAMVNNSIAQAFLEIVGAPYPLTDEGVLLVIAQEPGDEGNVGLAGVTYALVGSEGGGPFYFNANGTPDPVLTATTTAGIGGFTEVAAQVHVVQYGGTASNCTRIAAWPGEADGTIEVPVGSNFLTTAVILCN